MITNKKETESKNIVENRQARFLFAIEDTFDAGMVLEGWEVKSILAGQATFNGGGSYIKMSNGEAWIETLTITPLSSTNKGLLLERNPCRARKLLLKKADLNKLAKKVAERGCTIVPLMITYNGRLKIQIALAKGRNNADKRHTMKDRDLKREMDREFK